MAREGDITKAGTSTQQTMTFERIVRMGVLMASVSFGTTYATNVMAQDAVLRVVAPSLPAARGNPLMSFGTPGSYTYSAMYDSLVTVDSKGDAAGQLAAGWENLAPTKWRLRLRPDISFSNGERLDAAGMAANIRYLLTDEGRGTVVGRDLAPIIAAATPVDATTLEIETRTPNPELPRDLVRLPVVAPKAWADLGKDGFAGAPVGTGSYKVANWGPESITFESFEGSWRKPVVKRMTITALPEVTGRAQALRSGQIEIALALSVDAFDEINASPGVKAEIAPAPYILAWALESRNRDTPFKDKRVRQAVNYAVNKEDIVKNLYKGGGAPASQAAFPGIFGYNPNVKPYPYDPAKAKALLAEAGYPNGFSMVAELRIGNQAADADIYQQVAQDLGRVGIKTEIESITFADFVKKLFPGGDAKAEGFGPNTFTHTGDFALELGATAATLVQRAWSCRRVPGFYCNQDEIKLLEDAETEFDTEKRRQKLQNLMAVFHDNAPGLFITETIDVFGRSNRVSNLKMLNRVLNYHEVSLAR